MRDWASDQEAFRGALRALEAQWEHTQATWTDRPRDAFEESHWATLKREADIIEKEIEAVSDFMRTLGRRVG